MIVIDDLTDLLRAQKAAAWQEVAQRIAHEIKNPLTPIQLSAQRLLRYLERSSDAEGGGAADRTRKAGGGVRGIDRARGANAEIAGGCILAICALPFRAAGAEDVNAIVASALDLFHGRLEGVTVRTELAATLPPVKADRELLRRVLANLIDNAAEAMEGSAIRRHARGYARGGRWRRCGNRDFG